MTTNVRPLLRFITCGSVDDGKSTLIGRLLHDTDSLTDDLRSTAGGTPDFAALLDGLEDERTQGITIDVAYRQFATPHRRFIVADCPGHEQYTRNMATGASTADLAVVLVDARKGLLPQTLRHTAIVAMFGVRRIVLAVNKMDAVEWSRDVFESIVSAYREHLHQLHAELEFDAIPLSGLTGDNVAEPSTRMPWYSGPTLLQTLEDAVIVPEIGDAFRMPVQWMNRLPDGRGYAGTLVAGTVCIGDRVRVEPAGTEAVIAQVYGPDRALESATNGDAITLVLDRELDVARGDVLCAAAVPVPTSDQFSTRLLWMDAEPLLPGRSYTMQVGMRSARATLMSIKHRLDVETGAQLSATQVRMNEIASCEWHLDHPIAFEPFVVNRELGGFILVDRHSNATAGAGVIDFALRRSGNLHWQSLLVDRASRARIKGHRGRCLWLTGLSGAGKSAIADAVEAQLNLRGVHTYLLDGDNVRHGLNRDLGFTAADRVENIRRVAEVARLMVDAGLVVLVSFISPFRAEREMARELFGPGEFLEIFVDTPLAVAESRDPKGLYAKARAGKLPNFTGIDSPYEAPKHAELRLDTSRQSVAECAREVLDLLD
ncbi:adenylyl-sulfate kinase [Solilutibacter silvestris]|uniref:Adenylyl-sulfate kinase n=1 Tax=Solilutibacter silvestris TaxID=1645665 RepID=A0A2K1Q2G6_9GAMM|nr:adenylyl-sulfate kinase [Lysobacter silvestris]PNS09229.1 CysN: sulfate adenylyltransferase, large subunit [Lysobacter silvestris]